MAVQRHCALCIRCHTLHPFIIFYNKAQDKRVVPNCPRCGSPTLVEHWADIKRQPIKVKRQKSAKGYDIHPLDQGIPFGEVTGDYEDYGRLYDKNHPDYGQNKPGKLP